MADQETSKIMWVTIVTAVATTLLIVSKPALADISQQILGNSGKIAQVSKSISVKNIDWTAAKSIDKTAGTNAHVDYIHNTKYFVDSSKTLHVWSNDLSTPLTIDSSSKSIFYTMVTDGATSIKFDSPTTLTGDMSRAFANTYGLKTIDFTNVDTSEVTNMDYMFLNSDIERIDMSNLDTSNVKSMHGMFESSKAESIVLNNIETSNVTDFSQMFHLAKTRGLNVSALDTSKATNMSEMFSGLTNVQTLDLTNFDTSKVTNMKDMFNNSTNLMTIDLSGLDFSHITDPLNVPSFFGCTELLYVNFSNAKAIPTKGWTDNDLNVLISGTKLGTFNLRSIFLA